MHKKKLSVPAVSHINPIYALFLISVLIFSHLFSRLPRFSQVLEGFECQDEDIG
jgi:hypothetical protein